eukprot:3506587-Pleurochrysis_carterae.AAC.2
MSRKRSNLATQALVVSRNLAVISLGVRVWSIVISESSQAMDTPGQVPVRGQIGALPQRSQLQTARAHACASLVTPKCQGYRCSIWDFITMSALF